MGLLGRHNPLNRIYVCRGEYPQEQLTGGQNVVLFCDSVGDLTPGIVETSVLECAQDAMQQARGEGNDAAILCIEIAPGQSATFAVRISAAQAQALVQIHQIASEVGMIQGPLRIPEHLAEYAAQIIGIGESMRDDIRKRCAQTGESPDGPGSQDECALRPDLPTRYIEPNAAIVLKRLPPNSETRQGMQRVLILDYQGILCAVRIPVDALDEAEAELERRKLTHNPLGVIVFSTNEDGFLMGPMGITADEKKALDMVELYFETTGSSMDDIPTDVKTILARAKVLRSSRPLEKPD